MEAFARVDPRIPQEVFVAVHTPALASSPAIPRRRFRVNPAYFFLAPYTVAMLMFSLGPAIYSLLLVFATFKVGRPQFFQAGFKNIETAFKDPYLLPAFGNVLRFLVVSVPFGLVFVVLLALLLHARPNRFSLAMRTVYFLPGAVTGPALVMLFLFTFNPDLSVFRSILYGVGLTDIKQVVNNDTAPVIFTIMGFFGGAGGWIAVFYGALQGVSEELIEAAVMDGCSPIQLAWLIKRPLISRYIAFMLINVLAGNVQLFAEPQLMSSVTATISNLWSPNLVSYNWAFGLGNFGASAVVSVLMMVIGIICAYTVIRATNFYSTDATSSN
jgi:multiple sugar transport system permease protein